MSRTSTGLGRRIFPIDARHRRRPARARLDEAGLRDIDAFERGGEAIRIAFAPHLAVGDDIDAGPLHITDGDDGGVVLRLLKILLRHAPHLFRRTRARPSTASSGSTSQSGWGYLADDGRREQFSDIPVSRTKRNQAVASRAGVDSFGRCGSPAGGLPGPGCAVRSRAR